MSIIILFFWFSFSLHFFFHTSLCRSHRLRIFSLDLCFFFLLLLYFVIATILSLWFKHTYHRMPSIHARSMMATCEVLRGEFTGLFFFHCQSRHLTSRQCYSTTFFSRHTCIPSWFSTLFFKCCSKGKHFFSSSIEWEGVLLSFFEFTVRYSSLTLITECCFSWVGRKNVRFTKPLPALLRCFGSLGNWTSECTGERNGTTNFVFDFWVIARFSLD